MSLSAASMLIHLTQSYQPIVHLITSATFLTGMVLMVGAVYKLKVYGESRTMMSGNASLKEPLMMFFVAAIFMFLPSALSSALVTAYAQDEVSPLSYVTESSSGFAPAMTAVLQLLQIVGLVSFIRGWLHLMHAGGQGGRSTYGKGLTHILGGLMALNIGATKQIIWNTFGFL